MAQTAIASIGSGDSLNRPAQVTIKTLITATTPHPPRYCSAWSRCPRRTNMTAMPPRIKHNPVSAAPLGALTAKRSMSPLEIPSPAKLRTPRQT